MTYAGGIRMACIQYSFYNMISEALQTRGWLTSIAGRKDVKLIMGQLDPREAIKPNIIAISFEDVDYSDWETGSNLTEDRWSVFFDIFAENEDIGLQIAGDIYDMLRGKMPSIDMSNTFFQVQDYQTDEDIFTCEIDLVAIQRVRDPEKQHNKYWWVVGCEIVDMYYDDGEE